MAANDAFKMLMRSDFSGETWVTAHASAWPSISIRSASRFALVSFFGIVPGGPSAPIVPQNLAAAPPLRQSSLVLQGNHGPLHRNLLPIDSDQSTVQAWAAMTFSIDAINRCAEASQENASARIKPASMARFRKVRSVSAASSPRRFLAHSRDLPMPQPRRRRPRASPLCCSQ